MLRALGAGAGNGGLGGRRLGGEAFGGGRAFLPGRAPRRCHGDRACRLRRQCRHPFAGEGVRPRARAGATRAPPPRPGEALRAPRGALPSGRGAVPCGTCAAVPGPRRGRGSRLPPARILRARVKHITGQEGAARSKGSRHPGEIGWKCWPIRFADWPAPSRFAAILELFPSPCTSLCMGLPAAVPGRGESRKSEFFRASAFVAAFPCAGRAAARVNETPRRRSGRAADRPRAPRGSFRGRAATPPWAGCSWGRSGSGR